MIRLLASVRNVAEALAAAAGGADFIDLKEPEAGALGGLPPVRIREVVAALRHVRPEVRISATIGDHAADELSRIEELVAAVGDCGVDYVKVGVTGGTAGAQSVLLDRLAGAAPEVVPVFIADRGLDFAVVEYACRLPFPALMADTEDKRAGSLFDCVAIADLARFVALVRRAGKLVGLSGALREHHLPGLAALAPDFAGFRGALCEGTRTATLAPVKLARVRDALQAATRSRSDEASCTPGVV